MYSNLICIRRLQLHQINFGPGVRWFRRLDEDGRTPLHWAAGAGKVNTMEMLIARGATVDARSESDATPMHQAVLRDRPEAVKLLLNSNANVNLKNKSGYTPLDYATANKRTKITQLLKSAGALSGKAL